MTSQIVSILPATRVTRSRLFRGFSMLTFACVLSGVALAQTDQTPAAGDANANGNGGGRNRRGQNGGGGGNGGGRGNFDPAQMQQQMMDRMREQFGVTDDAEWKIITDRVTAVSELRRTTGGGFAGGFGGGGFRGGQNAAGAQAGGGRPGRTASPETDALRQAVTDKLPDAEIKSRLDRVREVRKANEEKLTKAQEELRAVLSVRQEAVAVMFGLLP